MEPGKTSLDTYNKIVFILLTLLAICVFYYRVSLIFSDKFPEDYDSFYYLLQFKRLRAWDFELFVTPGSLALWSFVGRLLNLSDTQMFYSFVTLAHLSLALAIVCVAFKDSRCVSGALIGLWILSSQTLFLDTYSHPRQTLALSLVAWGMAFCAQENWSGQWRVSLLWIIAAFTHPFASILSMAIAFGRFKRTTSSSIIHLIAVVTLQVISIFIISNPLKVIKVFPHLMDPWTLMTYHLQYSRISKIEFCCMLIGATLPVLGLWKSRARRKLIPISLVLFLCLIPIWRLNVTGSLALRLISSSYWPLAFVLIELQYDLVTRRFTNYYLGVLTLTLIFLNIYSPGLPRIDGPRFPTQTLPRLEGRLKSWMGDRAFVIAPFGVHSRITYFLGYHSWNAPPEDKYHSVFRLIRKSESGDCLRIELPSFDNLSNCAQLDNEWAIVKEKQVQSEK